MGALIALPTREDIVALQRAMIPHATPLPEPAHYFARGMYARKLRLAADSLTVGKVHRHEHLMIVLEGHAEIADGAGPAFMVHGGDVFVSPAGVKRAVLCYKDTTFLTVHLNESDTQDLSLIEKEHIAPDDAETVALMEGRNQGAIT